MKEWMEVNGHAREVKPSITNEFTKQLFGGNVKVEFTEGRYEVEYDTITLIMKDNGAVELQFLLGDLLIGTAPLVPWYGDVIRINNISGRLEITVTN